MSNQKDQDFDFLVKFAAKNYVDSEDEKNNSAQLRLKLAISNLKFKSKVEVLSQDEIIITGKSYSDNYDFHCRFSRVKE